MDESGFVEDPLQKLKGSRSAKLGALTKKKNEIKQLLGNYGNLELVQEKMENEFLKLRVDFHHLNESVKGMLRKISVEEMEDDQKDWYEPKVVSLREFEVHVKQWIEKAQSQTEPQTEVVEIHTLAAPPHQQPLEGADNTAETQQLDPDPHIEKDVHFEVVAAPPQPQSKMEDDLRLGDSASNFTKGSKRSSSSRSSASAARLRLQAEKAALMVKAEALQRKQALDQEEAIIKAKRNMEEAAIKAKKEQLELETEIKSNTAKLGVFEEFENAYEMDGKPGDGMNQYLEERKRLEEAQLVEGPEPTPEVNQPEQALAHTVGTMSPQGTKHKVQVTLPSDPQSPYPMTPLAESDRRSLLHDISIPSYHPITPGPGHAAPAVKHRTRVQQQPHPGMSTTTDRPGRGDVLSGLNLPQTPDANQQTSRIIPSPDANQQISGAVQSPIASQPSSPVIHHPGNRQQDGLQNSGATANNNSVVDVMRQQNTITEVLVKQQRLSSLPTLSIPTFKGDPLEYMYFIRAFEHGIEDRTENCKDRLHFLEQFTMGQPRELVRSCQHMEATAGYEEAKRLLKKHYGDEYKIAMAYVEKALSWQTIQAENAEGLLGYSVFLAGCCKTLGSIQYMEELDNPTSMKAILSKLPYKLKEKWRGKVFDLQERDGRRARFKDLVNFIDYQARIISHPVYGNLKEQTATSGRRLGQVTPAGTAREKKSGFSTNVSAVKKANDRPAKTALKCLFCQGEHKLDSCKELGKKLHNEKMDFLKSKGVCYGCLCPGHMSKGCTQRSTCHVCSLKHPTLLHIQKKDDSKDKGTKQPTVSSSLVDTATGAGDSDCMLSIVPVRVKMKKSNHMVQTYAFLDAGSTGTFCTEALLRELKVTGKRTDILLKTMNKEEVVRTSVVTGMEVCGIDDGVFVELPTVYTQKIPVTKESIPTQEYVGQWPYLHQVRLHHIDASIGLLIGSNTPKAMEPWLVVNSQGDGPYAVKTTLGWTINGPLNKGCSSPNGRPTVEAHRISVARLDELLQQQAVHDFPERQHEEGLEMSREDHVFMERVSQSAQLVDGHYTIGLPLRAVEAEFPNNRRMAEQRALGLKRKLAKSPQFHKDYVKFMTDIFDKGYATKVEEDTQSGERRKWYIPHHGVYHPKKHKLRVVFDCGASYQGTSLNAQLLQGPDLANSLIGVLTRFRQEPVAFITDVEAMFYQVKVPDKDSDLMRFLWWPNGNLDAELEEYKMAVHIFGATSSPSCANYALKRCAEDHGKDFAPEVGHTVLRNFYVDDCLKSVATEEQALALIQDLTALCATGGFKLNKWVSNSRAVIASIPEEKLAKEVKDLDLNQDVLPVERALGIQWCTESDSLQFTMVLQARPLTRRGILSMVSSVYDPLGVLAPVILPAKQILQELSRLKLSWDDNIPEALAQKWHNWLRDLNQLSGYEIQRCIKPAGFGKLAKAQLHHFADACETGYGTVSYLLLEDTGHQVHCAFIMGKARVAPLKPVTIPRMELTAATVAARVDKMMLTELELEVPLERSVFWTDSTSVLKYINNETTRFHTFVANRVTAIRAASEAFQWRYVNTALNPADCASRGASANMFLKNTAWIAGPDFVKQPESTWPDMPDNTLAAEDPEVRRVAIVNSLSTEEDTVSQLISHFSDWHRLKRSVAWILKIKDALKQRCKEKDIRSTDEGSEDKGKKGQLKGPKKESNKGKLSVEDLQLAEMEILKVVQKSAFSEEIAVLKAASAVKKSSHLYKLSPILQKDVLRVGGRLARSAMPANAKHPAILPKDHHVTQVIIRKIHQDTGHSGRNYTLSRLRQQYWVPRANAAIRKQISKCVVCRRLSGRAGEQQMADLPVERTTPDQPPFTNVGVDFFGPFEVKSGRKTLKRYGVIFTCLTIRAIHLEVAHTMDTHSCINAIRRFMARRGQVKFMRSDNGTNLVRAERELREAVQELENAHIKDFLLKKGITWAFNPPSGSHHGGIWERQIRTVRRVLSAILRQQVLDEESLQTLLCEVEAIVNDRPLTTATDDPTDLEPLTPNHLLLLESKPHIPPGVFHPDDCYPRRRWRQVQYLADLFWKRWTKEYLPELQERRKWNSKRRNFVVGDVVLIIDDTAPRNSWIMGRITETIPDSRGMVRQVQVKTPTTTLRRPITKLCLLVEAPSTS